MIKQTNINEYFCLLCWLLQAGSLALYIGHAWLLYMSLFIHLFYVLCLLILVYDPPQLGVKGGKQAKYVSREVFLQ